MKKINLNFMAVMIISLAIILVMNTMAVFAHRDEVLSIEAHKDNMLSFYVKHYEFMADINFCTKQYFLTNDEKFKSEFFHLINNSAPDDSFTLYEQFNEAEQALYASYQESLHKTIGYFTDAINQRDYSVALSAGFDAASAEQSLLIMDLSENYIGRLDQLAEDALIDQKYLEYALIAVSILLLVFAAVTFSMIIRENAYYSYLSTLYNTVVENIDGGIAILDKNGRFDYMNPKYKEILGIETEDPRGRTFHDTFDQNIADVLENITVDAPESTGRLDLVVGNKRKYIIYSYFTIEDEQGNIKYVQLLRDATKTEDLQAQLRKQLQEINFYSQAKDSFIANISHEIKTPINAILGMVHFLKSTRLSQNQKDLVRKIETSSDILLTIISDVLDLSKIKNNSLSLYPSDFSLESVIRNIEDMFSSQLSARKIEWRTNYDFNRELCLHLDKTRFVQVLVNLINNACKFTESGYVKLSIETISENEEIVLLQFCIEDTGIGIAENDISKLFREFEQLENHLTKQHQGTGLGLFICKNIIESMDGRMWVKSAKGHGSKFYFSIPAKKSLDQNLSAVPNVITAIPLDGSGGKALVVEDTEINAEVAVKLLNDVNIACDYAADGLAAVEMCRNKPVDYYKVILMDIHMPVMDGYTAANILKNEMSVTSPIIALTASDISEQTRVEYSSIIESFILKPFKAEAFYNAISPYFTMCDSGRSSVAEKTAIVERPSIVERNAVERTSISAKPSVVEKTSFVEKASLIEKTSFVEKASLIEKTSFAEKASLINNASTKEKASTDPLEGKEEAIKNLGGLESIYNKHINKFKANYFNTPETIMALLDKGNREEARRLAHSIKGLSGTLGMTYVMTAAAKLEKAILDGEGHEMQELAEFNKELKSAIEAIEDIMNQKDLAI